MLYVLVYLIIGIPFRILSEWVYRKHLKTCKFCQSIEVAVRAEPHSHLDNVCDFLLGTLLWPVH